MNSTPLFDAIADWTAEEVPADRSESDLDMLKPSPPKASPNRRTTRAREQWTKPSKEVVEKKFLEKHRQLPTCLDGMHLNKDISNRTYQLFAAARPRISCDDTEVYACDGLQYMKKASTSYITIVREMELKIKYAVVTFFSSGSFTFS